MNNKHDVRIERKELHPWLDYKLTLLLKKCAKKGIYLIITEGFRTKEYQDLLYAKGRTAPGSIVTNARGSSYSSQHMWGLAFDIAINDSKLLYDYATIKKVATIAKSVGLGWGGDWTSFKDTPHFYLKTWGSTTTQIKLKYRNPEEFIRTWTAIVKRDAGAKLFKTPAKVGVITRISKGEKVRVLYRKAWYAKVEYAGKIGYINNKFIK